MHLAVLRHKPSNRDENTAQDGPSLQRFTILHILTPSGLMIHQ